jgi:hypothetical protein
VVTYSHARPDNRIDNFFLGPRLNIGFTTGPHGLTPFASPF